jgi:type VI secretion system secreted protein Hcp
MKRRLFVVLATALVLVPLLPGGAAAWRGNGQSKMTLKLVGVPGDKAAQRALTEPLEVLAWSFGVYRQGPGAPAMPQDLSLTKWSGLDSPGLVALAVSGGTVGKVILKIENRDVTTITLYDVYISAVSTGGSGGEERFTENLTLSFRSFEVETQALDKDGKKQTRGSGRIQVPQPAGPGRP